MIFRDSRWPSVLLFQLHSDGIEAFSESSTPPFRSTPVFFLLLPWVGYLLLESREQLCSTIFGVSFFFLRKQEDDDDLQKRKDHDEGLHGLMIITFTKDYDIEFNNEFLDEQD
jgi:hypothetical protein